MDCRDEKGERTTPGGLPLPRTQLDDGLLLRRRRREQGADLEPAVAAALHARDARRHAEGRLAGGAQVNAQALSCGLPLIITDAPGNVDAGSDGGALIARTNDIDSMADCDFVLIDREVNPVARALRQRGVDVTAIHNHALGDSPRLFYMHFWANDEPVKLAQALKAALDLTNSRP